MNTKVRSSSEQKKRTPIPQGVRFNVLRRDNFTCRYCGRSSPDVVLHIDHAVSVKNGGTDDENNLVTSCDDCNYGKSSKSIVPAIAKPQADKPDGLVGMWGHTFVDDDAFPGRKMIQWQFKIIQKVSPEIYLCQLFSWLDGCPTNCEAIQTKTLVEECKLYASNEQMLTAYGKECDRRNSEADLAGGWSKLFYKIKTANA